MLWGSYFVRPVGPVRGRNRDLARIEVALRENRPVLVRGAAGVGITVLPELAVLPEFSDLTFLPLQDVSARREVYMFPPDSAHMPPAARDMAAAILATEFQPN